MTIELQKLVDGVWYTYGKYDMSNKHDNSAYDEAVSQLTKYFEIRTNVLYTPEEKIADIKANCDLAIEGRDLKITELEAENNKLLDVINNQDVKIADLEQQIEKMKCCENCKHSDTECEGHTVCNKGCFFDCLSNKIFDHTTDEKDYWEIKENE